jgi:hypothetical protein
VLDGNIGYMQVSQFSGDTDELALKRLNLSEAQGVDTGYS